ncbi:hypothetical protein B0O80DRAFT_500178 [Mortierella sp. GBAus27b]|nr:hypothetical protein BGX31_009530 [Mortierella sp. GBA43]KAI8351318.1 hypothetical protein B0O80DRAFT_500178 [Mortierella sp. GBAus27b]
MSTTAPAATTSSPEGSGSRSGWSTFFQGASNWFNGSGSTNDGSLSRSSSTHSSQQQQDRKDRRASIHSVLKAGEKAYKTKVGTAERKYKGVCKKAAEIADKEKAAVKSTKDKADRAAKEELKRVQEEASQAQIRAVIELVRNTIIDLKEQQQEQERIHGHPTESSSSLSSSPSASPPSPSSCSSPPCASSPSTGIQEDPAIGELVDYAVEILRPHMSKSQVRQRIMDEVLTEITARQLRVQQEARTQSIKLQQELEQQTKEIQRQQQQQQQQQQIGQLEEHDLSAPPAYDGVGQDSSGQNGGSGGKK